MEFKLNEYRRGSTDEDLLNDVIRVASELGDRYLSFSLYKTKGKYSQHTFTSHFGSWPSALEKAGLRATRTLEDMKRISNQEMIADIQRVAETISSETVTTKQYTELGGFSFPTVVERFGTWASALEQANLSPTSHIARIDDFDLFVEIERIWISLGKQPTTTEMKKGISKYSLETFTRRFGGWRNALLAFLEFINSPVSQTLTQSLEIDSSIEAKIDDNPKATARSFARRTSRNINLKLRFTVLSRDKFTCRACGQSPAKEPGVELHVDHVFPWSRGGETEISNLQTLCSKCNLGKSDHDFT